MTTRRTVTAPTPSATPHGSPKPRTPNAPSTEPIARQKRPQGTGTASTPDAPPTHCEACGSYLAENLLGRLTCLREHCARRRQPAGVIPRDIGCLGEAMAEARPPDAQNRGER